jgi:hypothetical protein
MIVYKKWSKRWWVKSTEHWESWDGWFLFGRWPIYVRRLGHNPDFS